MGFHMIGPGIFIILFLILVVLFLVTFLAALVRGIGQWNRNNHSPKLTVEAQIVSRRSDVTYRHRSHEHVHTSSNTIYYVTFQVASGDRMEFAVPGVEYGMLVEGDRGQLTFQGTRYLGFQRT